MNDKTRKHTGYGIGAVARMTGLSTHILRMWERRYGAVVAERAPNGRRIYSPADVEKLSLLKSLTEQGTAIGKIANLDIDALRAQAEEMDQIRHVPTVGQVRVAIFGESLPSLFTTSWAEAQQFEVVAKGSAVGRFKADLAHQAADLLLVESTDLDPDSQALVHTLLDASGAPHCLVVYRFARQRDEQALVADGVRLLRAPVAEDELALAIRAAMADQGRPRPVAPARKPGPLPGQDSGDDTVPPRRYTESQLQRLARVESSVDCECPRHMAEVIRAISAFETYSRDCENRNEADAALHAYLHRASAGAREVMETALAHLVEAEGLEV